jgi:ribonuclease-3
MSWISTLWNRLKSAGDLEDSSTGSGHALEKLLGYHFKDKNLLVKALKHRSYVYAEEGSDRIESNERLEFLGDAVLELLVTDYLFCRFEDKGEGELTQMKSQLVSRKALARQADCLGLGSFVLLSEDERGANGGQRPSILCDTLESLIGAIYLDGGLEAARSCVRCAVLADFHQIVQPDANFNFKSRLLEYSQSKGNGHPRYLVHAEHGPDHDKIFSVEVCITGQRMGWGQGRSKKEAQQMAAKDALESLDAL